MKQPSLKKLTEMVDAFNARFPVGTAVERFAMTNPLRHGTQTYTTSVAWVLGGHSGVVMVNGFSGGQSLEAIRVL